MEADLRAKEDVCQSKRAFVRLAMGDPHTRAKQIEKSQMDGCSALKELKGFEFVSTKGADQGDRKAVVGGVFLVGHGGKLQDALAMADIALTLDGGPL